MMIRIAQQVSRAIRILRGNRDESARASHLVVKKDLLMTYESALIGQAEREKCSQSTFSERKIMSTKTAFKRVALVAAAALAIGGISAVSANALTATSITPGSATGVVGGYDSIAIVLGTAETAKIINVASTGVGTLVSPAIAAGTDNAAIANANTLGFSIWGASTTGDVIGSAANDVLGGAAKVAGTSVGGATINLSAYSAVAGTQTITLTGVGAGTLTATITWGATPVVAAQYSQVVALAGSTAPVYTSPTFATTGASTAIVATGDAAGSQYASVGVTTMSSATAKMLTDSVSATISGPGTLGIGGVANPASSGRSLSFTETAGKTYVSVWGDGNAGTGTVTVTDGTAGVTLGTFTVTFVGSPTKASATQGLYVLKAGSTTAGTGAGQSTGLTTAATGANVANTVALTGELVDANGNPATGTVQIVSSNSAVISAGSCYAVTATAGEYQCVVTGSTGALSGQSATVTFEAEDSNSNYTILAAPLTFTIGGAVATEAFSTDNTSYNALAPVSLTLKAQDSAGNLAYDQDITAGFVSSPVSSTQLGGTDLGTLLAKSATTYSLINGVATYRGIYAPAVAGDFTITATDAASGNSEAVTPVTATSLGGSADTAANAATDAANEATDAANAATDAANAAADSADAATQAAQDAGDKADAALAAVTALSQQVTTLLSKVAALAATIAKIAKKVKA